MGHCVFKLLFREIEAILALCLVGFLGIGSVKSNVTSCAIALYPDMYPQLWVRADNTRDFPETYAYSFLEL